MQEIKLIASPSHPVTPGHTTSAKRWGSFTGALEELLGTGPEADVEIGSEDTCDLPPDATSKTTCDSQEQVAAGLIAPSGSHGIRFAGPFPSIVTNVEDSCEKTPDLLTGGTKPLSETPGSDSKPRSSVEDWNSIPGIEEGTGHPIANSPSTIRLQSEPNPYPRPVEREEDSKARDAAAELQSQDPSQPTQGLNVGPVVGKAVGSDSKIRVSLNEGSVLSAEIGKGKGRDEAPAESPGADKSGIDLSTKRTKISSPDGFTSAADTLSKAIEVDEDSSARDATSLPKSQGSPIVMIATENIPTTGNRIAPDAKTAAEAGIDNCGPTPPTKISVPGISDRNIAGWSLSASLKAEATSVSTARILSEPKVSARPNDDLGSKVLDVEPQLESTDLLQSGVNPDPIQHAVPTLELLSRLQNNFAGLSGTGIGSSRGIGSSKSAAPIASERTIEDGTLLASVIEQLHATSVHPATHSESRAEPAILPSDAAIVNGDKSSDRRIPERLILSEFDVTRFEFKTDTETHLSPDLQSSQMLQMMRAAIPSRDIKPVKLFGAGFDPLIHETAPHSQPLNPAPLISGPDAIQRVRPVFEPPPPPPVVRTVSMDIGDPESQVRVVIRERGGNLNVQFGSSNERLREDLQIAGPLLMRELQRNNPMAVTLDFSNFGSATDSDSQSRSQSQAKKFLKSNAEFAGVVETAYLPISSPDLKSL
jgi:hypothetical protein